MISILKPNSCNTSLDFEKRANSLQTSSNIHTHTHTRTHAYMFRASRGDHQSVLEFFTYFRGLCYSSGRAITGLSQSEDLRHLSVCREREISHREKRDGTQTSVTPESRPFQGNSTRNFCWCTPVHVLNHTSEEITIFAPKSFGQLNMRCCTILHGLTLFLRPRTSSLLTRTTVRRSKVLWMSSEVSLYKCTHTHTHTHMRVCHIWPRTLVNYYISEDTYFPWFLLISLLTQYFTIAI